MVKIKQGNIWGRLGTGVGKGLADQLPKEIERSRLASGLEDLSKNGQNLTPFQQFAKLSGTPGITPQMIQSGAELLKHQGVRNAYAKKGGMGQEQIGLLPEDIQQTPQGQSIRDVQFGNMQPNRMVIFPSELFHSAYHPIDWYFDNPRLTLVFWMEVL